MIGSSVWPFSDANVAAGAWGTFRGHLGPREELDVAPLAVSLRELHPRLRFSPNSEAPYPQVRIGGNVPGNRSEAF